MYYDWSPFKLIEGGEGSHDARSLTRESVLLVLTVVGQVFTQAVDLGYWQGTETGTTVGHHSEREEWRGR